MAEVVIVDGVRTAIGRFGGSLAGMPAADLGAQVVAEAIRRSGVEAGAVEEVVMGCVGQVAEDAFVARTAALGAGLPAASTAFTVNRLCGSGLQAILSAGQAIRAGDLDVAVAGGVENMSRLPFYLRQHRDGRRLGHDEVQDGVIMALTDPFGPRHMGVTAEAVARRHSVSRQDQDEFAAESQARAGQAIDDGRFTGQILPLPVPGSRKGETVTFAQDEHPRRGVTVESLGRLGPAFEAGGTVTAGNSSGINDAAAAVVVTSDSYAAAHGWSPRLRLVAGAVAGVEPLYMGMGPVPAIRRVLAKSGLSLADIDVVELNEAFAAQAVAVIREAGLDPQRTNPNGGAIALGHPIGATGAILTVKAMAELERGGGRYALVTMCIGGGQGIAAVFERLR